MTEKSSRSFQEFTLVFLGSLFLVNIVFEYVKNFRSDPLFAVLATAVILGVFDFVFLKAVLKK